MKQKPSHTPGGANDPESLRLQETAIDPKPVTLHAGDRLMLCVENQEGDDLRLEALALVSTTTHTREMT